MSLKDRSGISPFGRQLFLKVYYTYMTVMILIISRVTAICLWQKKTNTEKTECLSLGARVLPCRDKLSQQHPSAFALQVICNPGLPPSGMLENLISPCVSLAARSVAAKHF